MTTSKGINPVPDFKDKHFMLYETFKKQELLSPLKKDFKRNLTFSSFFEKKKQEEKPLSSLGFHIKNTGYQENKRVFVFEGV